VTFKGSGAAKAAVDAGTASYWPVNRALIVRQLRAIGTPQARAIEKMITRGGVRIDVQPSGAFGADTNEIMGEHPAGRNITLFQDPILMYGGRDPVSFAAATAGHEATHVLQELRGQSYTQTAEFEAWRVEHDLRGDGMSDQQIWKELNAIEFYRNLPKGP
jgi:hypothetical protein